MKFPGRLREEVRRRAGAAGPSADTYRNAAAPAGRSAAMRRGDFAPAFAPPGAGFLIGLAWFRTTQSFSFGQGLVGVASRDGGRSWSAAVLTAAGGTAIWDKLGGAVSRRDGEAGADLLDVYATAQPQIQQNQVGWYIKRYSFDLAARAWRTPAQVLVRAADMLSLTSPRPFRSFDGALRGLTWREQRTSTRNFETGGGTGDVSWFWENTGNTAVFGGVTYRIWHLNGAHSPNSNTVYSDPANWPRNSSPYSIAPAELPGPSEDILIKVFAASDGQLHDCTLRTWAQHGGPVGAFQPDGSYGATYGFSGKQQVNPFGTFVDFAVFGDLAYKEEGTGAPPTPSAKQHTLAASAVSLTLSTAYVYYAPLGADGSLGAQAGAFADVDFEQTRPTYARYDQDGAPVLAVVKKGDPTLGYRWRGGVLSAFTLNDGDVDSQALADLTSWRAALHRSSLGDRGAFHALQGLHHRKRNFPGQPDVTDEIVVGGGITPEIEAQLMAGDVVLFAAAPAPDVYAVLGESNGQRWTAYKAGSDALFGGFYDRPLDWLAR